MIKYQGLVIDGPAYDMLVHSRGDLWHLKHDRQAWIAAYMEEMQSTVSNIGFRPTHMLDIGSNLGAIDVLFAKAWGTHCTLVDGENGSGKPKKHAEPFCNRQAVGQFWHDNSVEPTAYCYVNPDELYNITPKIFDLVISFRSWCFHYAPERYLGFVQSHTYPGSIIQVDCRIGKKEWRQRLRACFREVRVIREEEKYERVEFQVRGLSQ